MESLRSGSATAARLLTQFGRNVRALREKAGISQEALADIALLDRTYVGAIERGKRNISLLSILKLADALGVPAGVLIDGLRTGAPKESHP